MFVAGQTHRQFDTHEHYLRREAHKLLKEAVRRGLIIRPDECEICGTECHGAQLHAHHDDYERPYGVRWLCRRCHYDLHREDRSHQASRDVSFGRYARACRCSLAVIAYAHNTMRMR